MLYNMAKLFKYASIQDQDVTAIIKSNPTERQDEGCYLQDLLIRASRATDSRFTVAIKSEYYIFHAARVTDTSVLEIEDAVSILNEFVRSGSGTSISTFYKSDDDLSSLLDKSSIHSCLVTLSHACGPFFDSLSLPIADLELLNGPSN